MRKLQKPNLPETQNIGDPNTAEYAKSLNRELDGLRRDLNKYVSILVLSSPTATVTLGADDEVVLCNGTFTVTLPPAASASGKMYHIKNIGIGIIIVDGDSSETIDDATTIKLIQHEVIEIVSDATEWWII